MAGIGASGIRIGNWFLWLDLEVADLRNDRVPMVTARRAVTGGDVLCREILTWEHVHSLRKAAADAEKMLQACDPATEAAPSAA
jgi:hypothetical protein